MGPFGPIHELNERLRKPGQERVIVFSKDNLLFVDQSPYDEKMLRFAFNRCYGCFKQDGQYCKTPNILEVPREVGEELVNELLQDKTVRMTVQFHGCPDELLKDLRNVEITVETDDDEDTPTDAGS